MAAPSSQRRRLAWLKLKPSGSGDGLRRGAGLDHESFLHLRHHYEEIERLEIRYRLHRLVERVSRHAFWTTVLAVALTAFGLAAAYGEGTVGARIANALHLFPTGFPEYDANRRWQLTLAEYLAALVSFAVTLRIVFALFADRVTRARARLRRRHVIVCGLGDEAMHSVRAFRAHGKPVTCLEVEPGEGGAEEARRLGALVLRGDATEPPVLRAAGILDADHLVCASGDDGVNARIAVTATGLRARDSHILNVYVQVAETELATLLRPLAAELPSVRLHFFSSDRVWARALLDALGVSDMEAVSDVRGVAVFGSTGLGTSVVVEAARRWHREARGRRPDGRCRIALVAQDAEPVVAEIASRYPAITRVCDLVPIPSDPLREGVQALLAQATAGSSSPAAVFLCLPDPSDNLALALSAEREVPSVLIAFPAAAIGAALGGLLGRDSRIRAVELPAGVDALDVVHDTMRETLAQEAHAGYLEERRREPDFGTRPADRPWEELVADSRESSRRQVDAMLDLLRAVWFELATQYDWDAAPNAFDRTTVEILAELEHERWCDERRAAGWRYGPVRDDDRKLHNLLVPWAQLDETARDQDRAAVRGWPALIAAAGFTLERSPVRETLAQLLHDEYVRGRVAAGEEMPSARPWDALSEEERDRNRVHADEMAVKLRRIGFRILPLAGLDSAPESLDEVEVGRLAEDTHRRWTLDRLGHGWKLGSREDRARTHPSLVPWSELPEEERQKDRELVRVIPRVLAEVGYGIVRDAGSRSW